MILKYFNISTKNIMTIKKCKEKYIQDFKKIHNDTYNYSKVLWSGVDSNIIVICPLHGDFNIRPADHKRGRGCQKCSLENKINPRTGLTYGELYENTILKNKLIINKGYNIIEVWENDWKNFIKGIRKIQIKWKNKKIFPSECC